MSITPSTPYADLGNKLVELRGNAHLSQNEFAIRVKTSQQTVSRWERGQSRPRAKQFDLIASVLCTNVEQLLLHARFTPASPLAVTSDQLFPVDSLTPESFEKLCFYLLSKLFPNAKVHRAGKTGHTQQGVDVEVQQVDGSLHTFQCKRVNSFGPANVKKAISAHTKNADRKYLFLSLIASPQARGAIAGNPEWEIWDKDDITLKIRCLSILEQRELVDTFFRGQRLPLLGETEAGPWMNLDYFFAPFLNQDSAFNHQWELIGRSKELVSINNAINDSEVIVTFLAGAGGAGKSKLLYQSLREFQKKHPSVLVGLLSATEEVTNKSLEELGNGEKLLVVDDAHEREDLPLLLHYAANPGNKVKILISLRSYGLERLRNEAASVNLVSPKVVEIKLHALKLSESVALARQVLSKYNGPTEMAEQIAGLTNDCPLATVIGSQIVTIEKIRPELLNNEGNFRSLLLGKFQKVVAGEIAKGQDSERIIKILKVLALIQPFSTEDENVAALIEKVELVSISDSARLIKLLINGGVLFKRGGMYRISPDLLADHIIENNCIDIEGKSSRYAERVFDKSPQIFLEHILLNLSKLDWKRSNGEPSNSQLLNEMWGKLNPHHHMSAMTAVSFYQPDKALEFAEKVIYQGKVPRKLAELIKYTAYHLEYLHRACECLWELGKGDSRELNQTPEHAIRILDELCAVEPNKPIEYCEAVVDFGLSLLDRNDSWNGKFTPYSILNGILRTEGRSTTSNGREVSISQYFVRQEAVAKLRERVIDVAIERLSSSDIKVATRSAAFLQNALHYPLGTLRNSPDSIAPWTREFVRTLKKIKSKIQKSQLDPLVYIEVQKAVRWHATHAGAETKPYAISIISKMPKSLDYLTQLTMVDGFGHQIDAIGLEEKRKKWEVMKRKLVTELLNTYPKAKDLYNYLETQLIHVEKYNPSGQISGQILYNEVIEASKPFAIELLEAVIRDNTSSCSKFAHNALNAVFNQDRAKGLKFAKRLLLTHHTTLEVAVSYSLDWVIRSKGIKPEELLLLRQLLSSKSEAILLATAFAVRSVAQVDTSLAIELLLSIDLSKSARVADEVLSHCSNDEKLNIEVLGDYVVQHILNQLIQIPELTGHWINEFIADCSEKYPIITASFLMSRVDYDSANAITGYRPINYGPYADAAMKFRQSSEWNYLLNNLWLWLREHKINDYSFHRQASRLFEVMFKPVDEAVVIFLSEKFRGDLLDLQLIGHVLDDLPHKFCLEQSQFVIDYLDKVKSFGQEKVDFAITRLYSSSVSGMRSGTPGVPVARDVEAKDKSSEILKNLSKFSPAYRLYSLILRAAEQEIESALKENELYED